MTHAVWWNCALAVAGTVVIWLGSSRLETASRRLAAFHGIPEVVKGAVITAIASSFPELSSVIVATFVHGDFELGVAAVVGSAIFNILVIPALSVLAGGALHGERTLVYKDALFYIVAVLTLLLTFSLAALYHPQPGEGIRGSISRELALIPLGLYAVYLFLHYQDTRDEAPPPGTAGSLRAGREWAVLLGCMLIIAAGVELLVRGAQSLGHILQTPSFLWGLTVVAIGTSLPDLVISVKAARAGRDVTSLSNVLGSNSFDLLVAVPAGALVAGTLVFDFSRVLPMLACLTGATLVLFVCLRREMTLRPADAVVMLVLYAAFVAWIALESFGVTSVLDVAT